MWWVSRPGAHRRVWCAALFILASIAAAAQVTAPDFSVVVLPDTQFYSESHPAIFNAQTQWIVNNSANYNIQFVIGEGDIVNVADQPAQWQNADAAVRLLDNAKIPYVLPLGNHDYDDFNPSARGTTAFNTYFGPSRYAQYSWYKGGFPSGTNDNFYAVFTVDGKQYLILALEFLPRDVALDWAKTVLDANPDKEIIVVSHSFLFTDSTRSDQCNNNDNGSTGNNQGEDVWQNLLINYPNLSLILNGHFTGSTASRRVDLGIKQNLVNEIFANYQSLTNGGNGWMRILTFRPSLNRIDIVTYSPYLNQYNTDSNNQFSITWHSTGTGNSTGAIAGSVRGERAAPSPYQCVTISRATLTAGGANSNSGSNGSFSLALPAGNYSLSAAAPGWAMTEDDEEEGAYPGYTSSAKIFLAPLLGTVAGKVTDGSENPLSGAAVAFSGGTIPTQIRVTASATGTYTVPLSKGSYNVTASAAGYTTATATTTVTQEQTTTLNFQLTSSTGGTCAGSGVNRTVVICAPANNSTVTSPVSIVAQATDSKTITQTQIYIDGVKKYQIAGGRVNTSLPLAAGTHRIAVLAQDSAGSFESVVHVTVSSSGLITPTITWAKPASITYGTSLSGTQLNATANVPGSFVYSPAAGTVLTVGTHTLSTTFKPSDTTHYTTAAKSVSIAVTSGGTACNAPSSPGVTVCSPANNGTTGTTVQAEAAAVVTGTFARMELWIDGVKKYSETTSTLLNTQVSVTPGSHRFAFLAINTAGQKWESAVNATAQ